MIVFGTSRNSSTAKLLISVLFLFLYPKFPQKNWSASRLEMEYVTPWLKPKKFFFFFSSTAILVLYILSARPLPSDLSAAATQGNYSITQWVSHHSYLSSGHCDELCGECIVWVYMSVCVSLQSVLNYACVNRHPTFPSMSWKFHIQYECSLPFILQHEANYWIISACISSNVCSHLSLLVSLEKRWPNMSWAGKIWNIINTLGQRMFF